MLSTASVVNKFSAASSVCVFSKLSAGDTCDDSPTLSEILSIWESESKGCDRGTIFDSSSVVLEEDLSVDSVHSEKKEPTCFLAFLTHLFKQSLL